MSRQGRLSRHKVSVGEPADGSPPNLILFDLYFVARTLAYENTRYNLAPHLNLTKIKLKNYYTDIQLELLLHTARLLLSRV